MICRRCGREIIVGVPSPCWSCALDEAAHGGLAVSSSAPSNPARGGNPSAPASTTLRAHGDGGALMFMCQVDKSAGWDDAA